MGLLSSTWQRRGVGGHAAGGGDGGTVAASALRPVPDKEGEAREPTDLVIVVLDAGEKWAGTTMSFSETIKATFGGV